MNAPNMEMLSLVSSGCCFVNVRMTLHVHSMETPAMLILLQEDYSKLLPPFPGGKECIVSLLY